MNNRKAKPSDETEGFKVSGSPTGDTVENSRPAPRAMEIKKRAHYLYVLRWRRVGWVQRQQRSWTKEYYARRFLKKLKAGSFEYGSVAEYQLERIPLGPAEIIEAGGVEL